MISKLSRTLIHGRIAVSHDPHTELKQILLWQDYSAGYIAEYSAEYYSAVIPCILQYQNILLRSKISLQETEYSFKKQNIWQNILY